MAKDVVKRGEAYPGLSWGVLNAVTCLLVRDAEEALRQERKPCDNGRDWRGGDHKPRNAWAHRSREMHRMGSLAEPPDAVAQPTP